MMINGPQRCDGFGRTCASRNRSTDSRSRDPASSSGAEGDSCRCKDPTGREKITTGSATAVCASVTIYAEPENPAMIQTAVSAAIHSSRKSRRASTVRKDRCFMTFSRHKAIEA